MISIARNAWRILIRLVMAMDTHACQSLFPIDITTHFLPIAQQPPVGSGPPHYRGLTITLRHTPQSVGLLWTGDQLVAETSTWQHTQHSQDTNIHAGCGIRTHDPSKRTATDRRLRRRGHWDRLTSPLLCINLWLNVIFFLQHYRVEELTKT
jgi:hypothetical protein